jgi:hypothetical protein
MTCKILGALALAALAGTASADILTTATQAWTAPISEVGSFGTRVPSPGSTYSNIDNSTGFFASPAGAAAGATKVLSDLVTMTAPNLPTKVSFSVVNNNGVTIAARPRVRFWLPDGAGGAPGTLVGGFSFNPITFAATSASSFFFDASALGVLPANIWVGWLYDNVGTTTTNAQLNNLGQLLYDAPVIGSSADTDWLSTAAGSNFVASPAGAIRTSPFLAAPNANYYLEIAPTPGTLAMLGLGGLVATRRRR